MPFLKPQSPGLFKFCITVIFSWKFTLFGLHQSIKVQSFRLLTAHVKFHQICTLMAPFVESL